MSINLCSVYYLRAHRFVHYIFMAQVYHNDLLTPYLELDQGGKVQAECMPSAIQPAFGLI